MADYLGDFLEDATVYIPFNTFTSDDPAASSTITNLANADIKVSKDGAATPITTDGATVVINLNSITGSHMITVDTSVDAAYSVGSDYAVRIEGTTVDGGTINAWVGSFSIENRFKEVDVTKINASANAATRLALAAAGMVLGTVDDTGFTMTTTEFEADDITEATSTHYVGRNVLWTSGALLDQMAEITAYGIVSGRGHFTVTTMTEAPANDDTFIVV